MFGHIGVPVGDAATNRAIYSAAVALLGIDAAAEFPCWSGSDDGRGDGSPGLRPRHHANDYCPSVLDRDGHDIAPVCHPARHAAESA